MSFKALVVPEDSTNNGYILKPLVERLLLDCRKPQAKVTVLSNPRVQGYEHAKKMLPDIFARYRHFDLILFMPDADGKDRKDEFAALEKRARELNAHLVCCAAIEEVETWLLAGHRSLLNNEWGKVRSNISVKEEVFDPFLKIARGGRRPSAIDVAGPSYAVAVGLAMRQDGAA